MRNTLQSAFAGIDWSQPNQGVPRSGPGSTLAHTVNIRADLPRLFADYNVTSFVDAPCGDWHWMQHVDLSGISYLGLDIVPDLVETNSRDYGSDGVAFALADVTSDPLPRADMLMCRDCLFHLKFWLRWAFFENFLASHTPWLLTTVHDNPVNSNVPENGNFRWFNPRSAPFNLPDPVELIDDSLPEHDAAPEDDFRKRRFMGLWHRDQIAMALEHRETA
mgnify:CR=1 FL=1